MFCRDSKLLVMEKMRRHFCIGPYGRFTIRLLLRSAAAANIRIYLYDGHRKAKTAAHAFSRMQILQQ